MEQPEQRTLWIGIVIGLAVYALGFVAPYVIPGERGQWVSFVLILLSLGFTIGWFIAVKRGFRLGKQTRQGRRLKSRKPPAWQQQRR